MKSILYFAFLSYITMLALDCCANDKAESLVDEWRKDVEIVHREMIPVSHHRIYREDLESYNRMIGYGVPIIPYIIELGKEASKHDPPSLEAVLCFEVLRDLTCKPLSMFKRDDPEYLDRYNFKYFFQKYIHWWEHGYKEDLNKFEFLYKNYNGDKELSVITEIQALGIRILPQVISKIEKGDISLIPVVEHLTNSFAEKEMTILKMSDKSQEEKVSLVQGWWQKNKTRYSIDYSKIAVPLEEPVQNN